MVIGCAGLVFIKIITNHLPVSRKVMGGDYAFITLLLIIALTGLALLMARATSVMGILFAIHFGAVLAFFLMMPYSKFVHGLYRGLALIKAAIERDRNKPLGE
jgi:citrate/tricarballylate utilization protein